MNTKKLKQLNQSGMMTLDFIFSITIALGICAILFAICFAFINVEVAQYIAFSASRAHSAGHLTVNDQVLAARNKYTQLTRSRELGNVFQNGWIIASPPNQVEIRSGVGSDFNSEYQADGNGSGPLGIPFIGVRFNLNFKMLDFNVPFLGRTSDGEDDAFTAKVASFLIREPTYQECKDFLDADRYDSIIEIDARFSPATATKDKFSPSEDNGC